MTAASVYTGDYVRTSLGIEVHSDASRSLVPVEALVGVALRRNPKRAHLLVSNVLAKHVPTVPGLAIVAGELLGLLVAAELDGGPVPVELCRRLGRILAVAAGQASVAEPGSAPVGRVPAPPGERDAATRAALHALRRDVAGSVGPEHPEVVTLGYAETATGLGHLVAGTIGSYYLHSTRHAPDRTVAFAGFEEEHSHATAHQLFPTDSDWLKPGGTVVLVDDELSTGTTVVNTITALQAAVPQRRWVVASLIDLRSAADRTRFDDLAAALGCTISVVALGAGSTTLPRDAAARAAILLNGLGAAAAAPAELDGPDPGNDATVTVTTAAPNLAPTPHLGAVTLLDVATAPVRSARFGVFEGIEAAVAEQIAAAVRPHLYSADLRSTQEVIVLGSEEFIALPLAVADRLDAGRGRDIPLTVRFSTTTRSPIAAIDRPDYAIASALGFQSHDVTPDGVSARFAYNLTRGGRRPDTIVVLPEPGTPRNRMLAPGGIVEALQRVTDHVIVALLPAAAPAPHRLEPNLVTSAAIPPTTELRASTADPAAPLPDPLVGPAFGSYAADDVRWLLKDLGDVVLEAPAALRESAIQSGRANYAESLPVEYLPSAEYRALYDEALSRSGRRVAVAVGIVTELILAARGGHPVLVSLARAGTPIGILARRWAGRMRGVDAPHYTMSIVRGVGLDQTALRYLATHHDPADVVFIDGWTGKGAIARELTAALALFAETTGTVFGDDLAVLADPGHCVSVYGTRDDYLIPSACLNSTVSGLVSRTVFNRDLIGPNDFHGAKFYRELSPRDVSAEFLDTICSYFDEVQDEVAAGVEARQHQDRSASWIGWQAVERISSAYGIDNVNLVKPGVGETTRVLLRRVPWKVLVRPGSEAEIAHVLLLAEQRGVEVELVPGLPYSCVGLINPLAADPDDAGASGAAPTAPGAAPGVTP
ncbi:phosphoribosyltransferase domain-containing protein [Subtercola boreus]|uniref:Phosphoribosyltransferase n=1 Tax=Subtercola boreus TaxID=120213 RepID=A0A3E0WEA2_9MICO|nr:phosphoribosyltransferase domain-containing protein [Subtercola boreus]RFA23560.1 hypothetical protein B7R24_01390 [Subtercola boreus]RFA23954.1 hypothetical protein B7R23_01390 [Subtercola boreus]RFA29652.1 hypothetical protein B7R25_01385 [Subtercola boreus]